MYMSSQPQVHRARRIGRVVKSVFETDSQGIRRNRVIATPTLDRLDPFLSFEEFRFEGKAPDVPVGPYRGFETITYILDGSLCHHDAVGGKGRIGHGEAQWVTAASGIMQADRPERGHVHGFHLWLNLPAVEKAAPPASRTIEAVDIPAVIFRSAEVKVLAGQYHGLLGPIAPPTTRPFIADVTLKAEGEVTLDIPADHEGFVYVFGGGGVAIEQSMVNQGQAAVLDGGNLLNLVAGADGARALVVTARPLKEPVARHGPFVMSTQQDLEQALGNYRNGSF